MTSSRGGQQDTLKSAASESRVAACGPHCGTKDKITRHCDGCHSRFAHGNAWWSRSGAANGVWQVRSFADFDGAPS